MRMTVLTVLLLLAVGPSCDDGSTSGKRPAKDAPAKDIEADYDRRARRAVPRDAFPVLFDPTLTPADRATGIDDDEPVIGVERGGDARAYPISIMGRHELVNDTCHGDPIAASW